MSNPWSYSPENSNVKFCIWVLRIRGCTVELVNSLFVFSVNIAHWFVLLYEWRSKEIVIIDLVLLIAVFHLLAINKFKSWVPHAYHLISSFKVWNCVFSRVSWLWKDPSLFPNAARPDSISVIRVPRKHPGEGHNRDSTRPGLSPPAILSSLFGSLNNNFLFSCPGGDPEKESRWDRWDRWKAGEERPDREKESRRDLLV